MATITTFEDLGIWQQARLLCKGIWGLTQKGSFARDFALKDQINLIFGMQWGDREKARIIDKLQKNSYKEATGNEAIIRSQGEIQHYYRHLIEQLGY